MVFGDVNLSENPIREAADGTQLNPGAGGWPTVRYFNKATGVGGAAYVKKTDKAMCDELKDVDNMITAVEEAASTSVCSVADGAGCSDKEKDYIAKWKTGKTMEDYEKQEVRLQNMLKSKLTDEATMWIKMRKKMLKQMKRALNPTSPAEL